MGILVLTFHSVMNHDKPRPWSFLSTPVDIFENTLKVLKKKGYKTISLQELYDIKKEKKKITDKLVVLNLDDGFLDNYTIVYPMLKKYGFKATVYVSPDFVDPRGIKREQVYEKIRKGERIEPDNNWGYMSWDELCEIDASGVIDVQGHAITHTWYPAGPILVDFQEKSGSFYWLWWNKYPERKPFWLTEYNPDEIEDTPVFNFGKSIAGKRFIINQQAIDYVNTRNKELGEKSKSEKLEIINNELSRKFPDGIGVYETDGEYAERLRYEIQTSKNIIEEKLNKEVRFMAWPGGGKNPLAEELARKAGYLAVTAKGKSVNETDDDLFYIYRVGGWSALKILGKHSAALEKLFIRMQLSRGKGKGGILQRFISRIGKIYRGRYSRKRRKKGEVSQ